MNTEITNQIQAKNKKSQNIDKSRSSRGMRYHSIRWTYRADATPRRQAGLSESGRLGVMTVRNPRPSA